MFYYSFYIYSRRVNIHAIGVEAKLVKSINGAGAYVGVEVARVGKAERVGGEPSFECWIVKAAAEKDQVLFCPFGGKSPGVDGVFVFFFAKGVGAVAFNDGAMAIEDGDDVPLQVMEGDVDISCKFDGNSGANVTLDAQAQHFQLFDGSIFSDGSNFKVAIVEKVRCGILFLFRDKAGEGIVGIGDGFFRRAHFHEPIERIVSIGDLFLTDQVAICVVAIVVRDNLAQIIYFKLFGIAKRVEVVGQLSLFCEL
ncbi:MAG: hypothetical protein S4CHLAM27_12650 [Chlamydiia bacterium]|nr:hypothetical protein [Chlamydiia bacterium]